MDMTASTVRDDDPALRPSLLAEFVGQSDVLENLTVFLASARHRQEAMDHVILHGPPGLGKTTLARIIAEELGVQFRTISAPVIAKPGDLVSALVGLGERDVLFVDEIHRLPAAAEEMLYSAMEDFRLDLVVGAHAGQAETVSIALPRFTLVGATTRQGMLSAPLLARFGISLRLDYYSCSDLEKVVARAAGLMNLDIEPAATREIAFRSRGTPRIAGRLLRRVRDFAIADGTMKITGELADRALTRLGVDRNGLDEVDRRYLNCLANRFGGGPAGLNALAFALAEAPETLETSVEPFLVRSGWIERTPRGRALSDEGQRLVAA